MNWKKIGKALLFPHMVALLLLLPAGTAVLVYGMLRLEESDPVRIGSYVLAFYTLMVWCLRVPNLWRTLRKMKRENRYVRIWLDDPRLRMNVTGSAHVLWNGAYAALQLGLGIHHRLPWFYSLAGYYTCLAVMRLILVWHTLHHEPGEKMRQEWKHYRRCGWIFLILNLALSGMVVDMIRENRTVHHHEITTIAMAAYTFTTLTVAIVNVVKYRKYRSPALSASKAISLAAACVSMLSLENAMLVTFGGTEMTPKARLLFRGLSGVGVCALIIAMAVYMIAQSHQKLKCLENEYGKSGNL